MNGSGRRALTVSRPTPNARKSKRGRRDDDKPYASAPDQGAAIDRLRRPHYSCRHRQLVGTGCRSRACGGDRPSGWRPLPGTLPYADGSEHESSGEYVDVVKPERLIMTWRWTGGVEDPGESFVEFRLRAVADGTELTLTHSGLHDDETRGSHEHGWTGALDKLERHFFVIEGSPR